MALCAYSTGVCHDCANPARHAWRNSDGRSSLEHCRAQQRIAANPDLLLATNFGIPESVFATFPRDAVIIPD
jgi:hypothetical protein